MITIAQRLNKTKKKIAPKRFHKQSSKKRRTALKRPLGLNTYRQKLLEQAAVSFNQGFDAGYDEAMRKSAQAAVPALIRKERFSGSEDEYKRGLYDGGDGIVDALLPESDILPELSIGQIIEAGVRELHSHRYPLLSATDVAGQIKSALDSRQPLSVVRLGDGELITLAQEVIMNEEQVRKEGHFLSYAGIHIPDLAARDQLVKAVEKADIVGIPKLRLPNFQPLAFAVLKAHGIDYRKLQLTQSTINYSLYLEGYLRSILAGRRVLVIGNTAPGLSQVLSGSGIHVTGVIAPVHGMLDIPRVMNELSVHEFDIALVGAGIPAVIIVQRIATELGKVAIDFGHLADSFVKGEAVL
ncbi:GT-D fold domain-containing protein [Paenibacillus abyssi]|uniref:GT-D fold-like domain-containing protein n=1 Tax=Paenibacillus abyssi TaxID=1340531 RepID=A0A917FR32_9BACL|nr:GT-D fold domain-containing glycosyltransferase [Paenibacillus abyssi]GGF98695.1 hypothetical protein GCM10010916_14930 [Paenibacillus abyssi]